MSDGTHRLVTLLALLFGISATGIGITAIVAIQEEREARRASVNVLWREVFQDSVVKRMAP